MRARIVLCAAIALTMSSFVNIQRAKADVIVETSISTPQMNEEFTIYYGSTTVVGAASHHIASYTNTTTGIVNQTLNVEYSLTLHFTR